MSAPAPPPPSSARAGRSARAAQSELRIGQVAAPRLTPDYHALVVLNAVLGGQFVSRMNMNLREDKGFTYGARSGFDFRRAPGPFVVQAACRRARPPRPCARCSARSATSGPPARPRPRSSTWRSGAHARLRAQLRDRRAGRARPRAARALRPAATARAVRARRQAVDIDAVTEAAQRFDRLAMTVAVVGDREKVEPGLARRWARRGRPRSRTE